VSGARVGARGAGSRGGSGGGRGGGGGSRGGGRGGGGSRDQGGDQGGQQYNQMDYEGGDPFASQYGEYGGGSQYGAPPGFAPQQYSYPYPAPMMQPTYAPPSFYSAPQYAPPQMPPSMANAYYNPYGATLPGTDLAPDPWGGFATPTAFSKYIDKYEQGIRHSAFDDAPLLGERVAQDFTEGEEREWGHQ
jgi:hypothetical protein